MGIQNLQNLKVKVVDDIRIRMVRVPMYTYLVRVRVTYVYECIFDITSICIIRVLVHIHYRYVLVLYE